MSLIKESPPATPAGAPGQPTAVNGWGVRARRSRTGATKAVPDNVRPAPRGLAPGEEGGTPPPPPTAMREGTSRAGDTTPPSRRAKTEGGLGGVRAPRVGVGGKRPAARPAGRRRGEGRAVAAAAPPPSRNGRCTAARQDTGRGQDSAGGAGKRGPRVPPRSADQPGTSGEQGVRGEGGGGSRRPHLYCEAAAAPPGARAAAAVEERASTSAAEGRRQK